MYYYAKCTRRGPVDEKGKRWVEHLIHRFSSSEARDSFVTAMKRLPHGRAAGLKPEASKVEAAHPLVQKANREDLWGQRSLHTACIVPEKEESENGNPVEGEDT